MQTKENERKNLEKIILFQVMTKEARERINIVRSVNPRLAERAEKIIINAAEKRGPRKIGEEEVKELLQMLSKKRETRIRM
jgi:DNA-binding TFAR19-related protein (PDSD5 family)